MIDLAECQRLFADLHEADYRNEFEYTDEVERQAVRAQLDAERVALRARFDSYGLAYVDPILRYPDRYACTALSGHLGRCLAPVDAIVRVRSGHGDGEVAVCAAHLAYLVRFGRGAGPVDALWDRNRWRVRYRDMFAERDATGHRPRRWIREERVRRILVARVRRQFKHAYFPPPCTHGNGKGCWELTLEMLETGHLHDIL